MDKFKRFDVREMLSRGVAPFPRNPPTRRRACAGRDLIVRAPLLPSRLVEKLNGEGLSSKVEKGDGADRLISFWREMQT